jgi:phosphate transport system permease protein
MSTVVQDRPPIAGPPAVDLLTARVRGRRRAVDIAATALLTLSFVVALVPLGLVFWYVVHKGAGIISSDFLTADIPRQPRTPGGGMGPAVVGTIVITGAASLMAIPLGILGAIYLNEFGGNRAFAKVIRFMSDVMTGVPSIVMGLFIYVIWVQRFHSQSGFAGALALGCLMLPIVIRTTDEMLKLVPDELRHGSVALGARSFRTTVSVVIPTALPGIVSGAMLAVARAAGETAPLLFTIGVLNSANWSLSGPNTTLSAQIFRNASQPFQGAQDRAWGAALTLVVLVFVLTLIARFVASRFTLKHQ